MKTKTLKKCVQYCVTCGTVYKVEKLLTPPITQSNIKASMDQDWVALLSFEPLSTIAGLVIYNISKSFNKNVSA